MTAIYKKELRASFRSMTGCVYVAIVMLFIGLTFRSVNLVKGFPYFAYSLSGASLIFIIAAPILTMRAMAEERRYKTDQMLLTSPVPVTAVVLGKFFAMATVYAVPLIISCLCPLVIALNGDGSLLIDYSAVFAFFCLGLMMVSIGLFISSLTESQVIAAACTAGALLALLIWPELTRMIPETTTAALIGFAVILALIDWLLYALTRSKIISLVAAFISAVALGTVYAVQGTLLTAALRELLRIFSAPSALSNFTQYYVFDIRGIVFFLSSAALFVFLTVQTVQRRRWN